MDKYITSLVTNRDLLRQVVESTNSDELWNPTYAELFALMEKFGIVITVTPGHTHATSNHILWTFDVFEWDGRDGNSLKHYTENVSYTTWAEAADNAMVKACEIHDRQVRDIEGPSLEEKKFQELDKKRKAQLEKRHSKEAEKAVTEDRDPTHTMGHKLYGRHSDEDPLIFE